MIVGIGTDIVQIERISASLEKLGDGFAKRILTETEFEIFRRSPQPAAFLAKRFAVKEAASKALGTGIGKVSFQHLEVSNNALGAPVLTFSGYAAQLQKQRGITQLHLSISDEKDSAIAFVVLEAL
ncbi:holo-ACP synthase [Endozoicomonas sp. (ex Bugula neritina AB1)]|nr:holo-ACP synthase [Endozoicomonas sp. (ex Bugula neritina AB1)]